MQKFFTEIVQNQAKSIVGWRLGGMALWSASCSHLVCAGFWLVKGGESEGEGVAIYMCFQQHSQLLLVRVFSQVSQLAGYHCVHLPHEGGVRGVWPVQGPNTCGGTGELQKGRGDMDSFQISNWRFLSLLGNQSTDLQN